MKGKFIVFGLFLFFGLETLAQTETLSTDRDDIIISLGYGMHSNSLNRNYDMEVKDGSYGHLDNLQTLTLKVVIPTKKENIDLFVGALIEKDLLDDSSLGYTPGKTNEQKHVLNGGGIFAGVRPTWKKKYFGLTSEFGMGAFSYKETYSHFNNTVEPYLDIHMEKSTFGLGGYSSVGFYVKIGNVGINPNVNVVVTGGENGSFLFYGGSVPLTIQF